MSSLYDDLRASLDSALAESARAERRELEARDLLARALDVINQEAETVLADDIRTWLHPTPQPGPKTRPRPHSGPAKGRPGWGSR